MKNITENIMQCTTYHMRVCYKLVVVYFVEINILLNILHVNGQVILFSQYHKRASSREYYLKTLDLEIGSFENTYFLVSARSRLQFDCSKLYPTLA